MKLSLAGSLPPVHRRGMFTWVYASPNDPIDTVPKQDAMVSFMRSRGVRAMFLDMYAYVSANNASAPTLAAVRSLVARCTAAGIDVYGMAGATDWATDSGTRSWVDTNIGGGMATYQTGSTANEKFKGFLFDVEYWTVDPVPNTVTCLTNTANIVADMQARGLSTGLFVASWQMDNTATRPSVSFNSQTKQDGKHLADMADFCVVGTYQSSSTNQLAAFDAWGDYAEANPGVVLWAGAEANDIGAEISYSGQSLATMYKNLEDIDRAYVGKSWYRGIVVHEYRYWQAMT